MYRLARNLKHPEHCGNDARRAIVEMAWKILSDGKSRAAYLKENDSFFETLALTIPPPA